MDDSVKRCFQIIAIVGEAKASYIESMRLARYQQFEKAREYIKQADKSFSLIYDLQNELPKQEAQGMSNDYHLLFVHTQDQIMSVEHLKIMAMEMNACYEKIFDLEKKIDRRK